MDVVAIGCQTRVEQVAVSGGDRAERPALGRSEELGFTVCKRQAPRFPQARSRHCSEYRTTIWAEARCERCGLFRHGQHPNLTVGDGQDLHVPAISAVCGVGNLQSIWGQCWRLDDCAALGIGELGDRAAVQVNAHYLCGSIATL